MKVLNQGTWVSRFHKDKNVADQLIDYLKAVRENFYDTYTRRLDYPKLARSEVFNEYLILINAFPQIDIEQFDGKSESVAFWLNIYNALVIHSVIENKVQANVNNVKDFFDNMAYDVGGYTVTLDDIEHGILRVNRPKYGSFTGIFSRKDTRLSLMPSRLDPRIHCGLFTPCNSSAQLEVFELEKANEQLFQASRQFLAQRMQLDRNQAEIRISKIFKWYRKDFGDQNDLIEFLAQHCVDDRDKIFLRGSRERLEIEYDEYDWTLNGPSMDG